MSVSIEARQVGVTIHQETLLAPISFTLPAGQALAVTGPNGSGKTTLLRLIAGLRRPTGGTLTIDGRAADERSPRFRSLVAALTGTPPLAPNMTLQEQLVLVDMSWGRGAASAVEHATRLLEEFGIGRLASRFPHETSSGQAQLFALALTLARPFSVLVLDEPEQRLDVSHLEMVGEKLRRVVAEGRTLILASHSTSLVDAVTDDVLHLAEPGCVVSD